MPWFLMWYESKAPRWRVPDPVKHRGRLIKTTVVPTFSFDIDTVKLTGRDRVIMEGYGIFPNPPVDTIWVGSDDGVRVWVGPFKVEDYWRGRAFRGRWIKINPPATAFPNWRVQYFNWGGAGRIRIYRRLP